MIDPTEGDTMTPETLAQKMARIEALNHEIEDCSGTVSRCGRTDGDCGLCRRLREAITRMEAERDALAAEIEGRAPYSEGDDPGTDETAVLREQIADLENRLRAADETRQVAVRRSQVDAADRKAAEARTRSLEEQNKELMRANHQAQLTLNEKIERVNDLASELASTSVAKARVMAKHKRATLKITALVAEVAQWKKANSSLIVRNTELAVAKNNRGAQIDRQERTIVRLQSENAALKRDVRDAEKVDEQRRAERHALVEENAALRRNLDVKYASPILVEVHAPADAANAAVLAEETLKEITKRVGSKKPTVGVREITHLPDEIRPLPKTTISTQEKVQREIALNMAVDFAKSRASVRESEILAYAKSMYAFLVGEES